MTWRMLAICCFSILLSAVWGCDGGEDATDPKRGSSSGALSCPPDDPATPSNDESECKEIATVEAGGTAVQKRGCVRCHGSNMAGRTTKLDGYPNTNLGEVVELFPPNLTPDPETGAAPPDKGGTWTDDALALAIRFGVDHESQTLCPQMQHFSTMSDFEVYSIVKYLRSIPPVKNRVPRSVCPPLKTKEQQNL